MQQNGRSDVERLIQQIEQEHQAAFWALNGLQTGTAQHAFISRRLRHMGIATHGLEAIIGEEKAIEALYNVWNNAEKTEREE